MSFANFPSQPRVARLLRRSVERGRVAHAYLFAGQNLAELEGMAATFAKVLNCQERRQISKPARPADCCDECKNCRRIDGFNHPDVRWVRPESKLRVIKIEQTRELMEGIHLKPNEADFKVAIIVGADRLTPQAANAFLKTLEEPPARSVLLLLTTQPQRALETIVSRCLWLDFARDGVLQLDANQTLWLRAFSEMAAVVGGGLLDRYRLLGLLVRRLNEMKEEIENTLAARSSVENVEEVDADVRERWEEELAAATEAEYRGQRAELVAGLHWWLRDIWLRTLSVSENLLGLPCLEESSRAVARRLNPEQARRNLELIGHVQRSLHTNTQESLLLEVSLLKLNL